MRNLAEVGAPSGSFYSLAIPCQLARNLQLGRRCHPKRQRGRTLQNTSDSESLGVFALADASGYFGLRPEAAMLNHKPQVRRRTETMSTHTCDWRLGTRTQ